MGVKKRLSHTLGQIKKGFPCDTFEGGFPVQQAFLNPATGGPTDVHGAITLTAAEQEITTAITDPDFYRCLRVEGSHADVEGALTVEGTDWADRLVEEQFTLNGTAIVSGTRPFKTVTKITVPAQAGAAIGQNVTVGCTDRLGLYRPLASGVNTIELLRANGTREAAVDVDEAEGEYATFRPTTAPNGSTIFEVNYLTDVF